MQQKSYIMKKVLQLLFIAIAISACKNEPKENSTVIETIKKEDIAISIYPEAMTKVFDAHGGIDQWNKMQALSFTVNKPNGKEITTTDLKSRAELIDTPNYTQGFDGKTLWVKEKNDNEFKGNAKFYKGLMMYFYAMPFIVGDSGIIYKDAEPLTFEGKTYPGILIAYEAGIGESPDDEYIIYFDAETGQMQWLAYTVTFGKDGKSKEFKFIRYNNWQTVNGIVSPKSVDWYKYENNLPTEKRNTVEFTDPLLSKTPLNKTMFSMPEGAKVIE